jgi:hypothetical protein
MSSIDALPVEILDAIFGCLPSRDLVALALSCSAFVGVSQVHLYRTLSLHPWPSHWQHNVHLLRTLAKNPVVASYVRSLSISIAHDAILCQSFYSLLRSALANASELVELQLFIDQQASHVLAAPHHSSLPIYNRLERFTTSLSLDAHTSAFLCRTPALERIEIDSTPCLRSPGVSLPPLSIVPIPPACLPRLNQFVGSARAAREILPGRPVQYIYLHEGDIQPDDFAWISASTTRVDVLEMVTSAPCVPIVRAVAAHLPDIVSLRVLTTYTFPQAPDTVRTEKFYSLSSHTNASFFFCPTRPSTLTSRVR